ncbi:MAG: hypothetical protein GY941_04655 [Planctomycetes bacterium]|nr:hypothetical protein [Planctomycetota bacterium]
MPNNKRWVYSPKKNKIKVSVYTQQDVQSKVDQYIESVLKPKYIKKLPKNYKSNYLINLYSKWHGHYFYLCGEYANPGPNAIAPTFDLKFARFEYTENNTYNVSYMRHTEKWLQLFIDLDLEEALSKIVDNPYFLP